MPRLPSLSDAKTSSRQVSVVGPFGETMGGSSGTRRFHSSTLMLLLAMAALLLDYQLNNFRTFSPRICDRSAAGILSNWRAMVSFECGNALCIGGKLRGGAAPRGGAGVGYAW